MHTNYNTNKIMIVLLRTSHLAVSWAHCSSSSLSFSFSSSSCRLTVTVSSISRSTMRPYFCIIILEHWSCICLICASKRCRSLISWTCFLRASLQRINSVSSPVHSGKNDSVWITLQQDVREASMSSCCLWECSLLRPWIMSQVHV